jgi:hypothetical protein
MPLDFNSTEAIVIGILILIQLFVALQLLIKIIFYKNIFKNAPTVESKYTTIDKLDSGNIRSILYGDESSDEVSLNTEEISYLDESLVNNNVIKSIVEPINNYVVKNKGIAIDFHILKDIVDRNVEIVEEEISNRVPAPLYIGLAATMLGIIIGLVNVKFDGNVEADNALIAMKPLIDGVKIAMSASVLGLALTTIFSVWIFKNAKVKVEKEKSDFLSLIESELMPKMNRSKLPEVDLLAQKLDKFSRNTVGIVSNLEGIFDKSKECIQQQQKLLDDVKKLDIQKVSSANLQILNKLEGMMPALQNFEIYYERLNKSLVGTTKLIEHLENFVANTEDINSVLKDLKSISSKSDESAQFFNQHIKSFSKYGQAVNESIADSDSKMAKAIDTLGESAKKQFEAFNEILGEYDIKLSTSFDTSIERFNETMQEQAERTIKVLDAARPKFEKLNQLDKLDVIEKRLETLESGVVNALNTNNNTLIQALKKTQQNSTYTPNVIMHPETERNNVEDKEVTLVDKIVFGLKISSYVIVIITGIAICYSIIF